VAAAQLGQRQWTGHAAAPFTQDGDIAEFGAQLLFLGFGLGVAVGKDVQQV
jgi:hypothetical protein